MAYIINLLFDLALLPIVILSDVCKGIIWDFPKSVLEWLHKVYIIGPTQTLVCPNCNKPFEYGLVKNPNRQCPYCNTWVGIHDE